MINTNPTTVSPAGIELISRKGHDDCTLQAYLCASNKVTIGYGHVLLPKFDWLLFRYTDAARLARMIAECRAHRRMTLEAQTALRINQTQAEELLSKDVEQTARFLRSVTAVTLNQNQFDALASFIFNVGQGQYATSTLRKKLHDGDFAGAAAEFDRWVKGTGADGKKTSLPGLITRRAAERALFESQS